MSERFSTLGQHAVEVVRKSPLPVLVLGLPDEVIVAASPAAQTLLGSPNQAVEGCRFEDFTADEPSGALPLIWAGCLHGYEASRRLRRAGRECVSTRIRVRAFGDDVPPRYVLAVLYAEESAEWDAFVLSLLPAPSCAFALLPTFAQPPSASVPAQAAVPGLTRLSARERDIVRRLLDGDRVPAIAGCLFLSQSTVRNHLAHVYRKLGVGSQQELINLLRHSDDAHLVRARRQPG